MVSALATGLGRTIDGVVRWLVLPMANAIPFLVRTGLLFLGFAALWLVFLGAAVLDPSRIAAAWAAITALPLPVQLVAWLLFLPLMAGLWVASTTWPVLVKVLVVGSIGTWNLLAFLPRRGHAATPTAEPAAPAPAA